MKNIHLIPTDKPSRLYSKDGNHILDTTMAIDWYISSACYKPQNIYITSDEKFNRDEYVTDGVEVIKATPKLVDAQGLVDRRDWKKIILTTDLELINDGVQGIDDEFLNWFIKNPGCDYVKVKLTKDSEDHPEIKGGYREEWEYYEIVIPKEEPKQTDENGKPLTYWGGLAEHKQNTNLDGDGLGGIPKGVLTMLIGEKEETLEGAAEMYAKQFDYAEDSDAYSDFIEGAKWQQEQDRNKFSKEDMEQAFIAGVDKESYNGVNFDEWFEQIKKK